MPDHTNWLTEWAAPTLMLATNEGEVPSDQAIANRYRSSFESVRAFAYAEAMPARTASVRQPQIRWFGTTRLTFSASYLLGIPNDRVHANSCLLAERSVFAKLPHWSDPDAAHELTHRGLLSSTRRDPRPELERLALLKTQSDGDPSAATPGEATTEALPLRRLM